MKKFAEKFAPKNWGRGWALKRSKPWNCWQRVPMDVAPASRWPFWAPEAGWFVTWLSGFPVTKLTKRMFWVSSGYYEIATMFQNVNVTALYQFWKVGK